MDTDSEPDDLHYWMNEEDLGDLEQFYGGMMMMGQEQDDLDFLFDDDDYDGDDFGGWYHSDESEFSDSDSDHNKIFVTLQDSAAMRKLNFHKAVNDGRFRLPRCSSHKMAAETYESLFRVLEELEILLKVWRKRTQHALTAHIQGNKEKGDEKEEPIKGGVDYHAQDVEHESDCEDGDGFMPPSSYNSSLGGTMSGGAAAASDHNLPLTKKKFCQSTRMFNEIFASEKEFAAFLSYIHKLRKEVHGVLFELFLGQLQEEARIKLPTELWEKIWRMTQMPYREIPYLSYSVGYRHDTIEVCEDLTRVKNLLVERDRVTELFGAVGNFHMLVFEVLYKHSYITQTPPLMEVDCLDVKERKAKSYLKSLFGRYKSLLVQAHARFSALDFEEDEEEEETQQRTAVERVKAGSLSLSHTMVPVFAPKDAKSSLQLLMRESQFFVTSNVSSSVVALLDYEVREDKQPYLRVVLWHAKEERKVADVNTGCTLLDVCCGRNRNATNQLFALTSSRFAFVRRLTDQDTDSYTLSQWTYSPDSQSENVTLSVNDSSPVLRGKLASNMAEPASAYSDKSIICLRATVLPEHGDVWLLHHQNPYKFGSRLVVISTDDVEGPQEITSYDFPDRILHLECVKGSRAIFREETPGNKQFLLINLCTGKILSSYKYDSLCKDADHDHTKITLDCIYEAKMDMNPARTEFVLFSQNMSGFQLFSYDESSEDEPEVITSGSTLVHAMPFRMLSKTALVDGVVYAAPSKDVSLRSHVGDYFRDDELVYGMDVFAFDLRTEEVHPIVSLLKKSSGCEAVQEVVLTNDHSRRFHADILTHQYPYFLDDSTLLLPMLESYIRINLHSSHRPSIAADAVQLHAIYQDDCRIRQVEEERRRIDAERQAIEREKVRKSLEEKRMLTAAAREKYLGTGEVLSGKVKRWTHSYGFLKLLKPDDSKVLGDVFVHISDFEGRGKRFIRVGQKVEFRIEEEEEKKEEKKAGAVEKRFKAVKVVMMA